MKKLQTRIPDRSERMKSHYITLRGSAEARQRAGEEVAAETLKPRLEEII